ncbi:MAG: AEC family transporter [Bosea sp. (in: a-proteobacteria)]
MDTLLFSLISVFLVIVAGFAAKATRFIDEISWRGFEAVTYHVLIPALVIHTLAYAKLDGVPVLPVGGALVAGAVGMTLLTLLIRKPLERIGIDGPAFSSVYQGSVRWNTFIALAVASHQFGNQGVALMAVLIASLIPLVNVMSVLILSRYAQLQAFNLKATCLTLIRNPFIWSCAIGLMLNPLSGLIPPAIGGAVDIMGRAALAAGLLVVGSGLDFQRLKQPRLSHGISIVLKLLLMPFFVYLAARSFGLTGVPLSVAMIAATVPTAAASYILARQMGGDAPLMAEITTIQTLLAMLTMPIILLTFVM